VCAHSLPSLLIALLVEWCPTTAEPQLSHCSSPGSLQLPAPCTTAVPDLVPMGSHAAMQPLWLRCDRELEPEPEPQPSSTDTADSGTYVRTALSSKAAHSHGRAVEGGSS
jgi:hypothetical protein